jgi:hypothetical protein
MGDELVPVEIPVDPSLIRATLFQAQDTAVEAACLVDVIDGYGQVERCDGALRLRHAYSFELTFELTLRGVIGAIFRAQPAVSVPQTDR